MSAPTIIYPPAGGVAGTFRSDDRLALMFLPNADTMRRVQMSTSNTFPAPDGERVYDSGMREPDDLGHDLEVVEVELSRIGEAQGISEGAVPGTIYYASAVGDVATDWAGAVAITIEAATTAATWRDGQ